jgi:hypothetical protein
LLGKLWMREKSVQKAVNGFHFFIYLTFELISNSVFTTAEDKMQCAGAFRSQSIPCGSNTATYLAFDSLESYGVELEVFCYSLGHNLALSLVLPNKVAKRLD